MLFHTHEFLLLLVVTLAIYQATGRGRQTVLLMGSLVFYAYAGLDMAALFLAVVAFNWFCYQRIGPGRGGQWLALAIGVDLANLFTFKYTAFFLSILLGLGADAEDAHRWAIENVVLPVGISFYTFQLMALLIDSHRGSEPRARSFREFLLFVTFFGQLIAGPIMRGREFLPQLQRMRTASPGDAAVGLVWFGVGLVKKVVLADQILAPRVEHLFSNAAVWDAPTSWFLGILFGFQIYFDFSGYCDMAVGLGRFFGLDLRINFSTPYVSRTPSEFWSRWNITLSRWFGDYVYIPLGGSRIHLAGTVVNLLVTMLVSGLWHGAGFTFLVWGALHGVALSGWHAVRTLVPSLRRAAEGRHLSPVSFLLWTLTLLVTVVGWVYFRADSVSQANAIVAAMFGARPGGVSGPVGSYAALSAVLLAAHFAEWRFWIVLPVLVERALALWQRLPGPLQAALAAPLLLLVVGATKEVQGAFIYFQF